MRRGWSISHKILLLVLASVLVGLLAAATLSIGSETNRYLAAKQRELEAVASAFASAAAGAVVATDPVAARNAMRAIGQIPGMQYARINMPSGDVLAEMGASAQLDSDLRIGGGGRIPFWRTISSRSVQVVVPIKESG